MMAELSEGWRYVRQSLPIRSVLLFLALVSLVGMPYTVLMPIFARAVLHGGAHTLGFLMAAAGLGALAVFGLSRMLWLSLAAVAAAGFSMMRHMAASNTILQTIVLEDKRGRVMAYYSMAFEGMAPIGSLAAGAVAAGWGAPWTVIGGVLRAAGAVWFASRLPAIRRRVRPVYVERGILPPGRDNRDRGVTAEAGPVRCAPGSTAR